MKFHLGIAGKRLNRIRARSVMWQRRDAIGLEYAEIELDPLRLEGEVLRDAGSIWVVSYVIECDSAGVTARADVHVKRDGHRVDRVLSRRSNGEWTVDGDLARLGLPVGEHAEVQPRGCDSPSSIARRSYVMTTESCASTAGSGSSLTVVRQITCKLQAIVVWNNLMLQIYWGSGSPFAWRVLLAAEIKRIPYESKLLEFSKGDHKKPEFLALNPRGKVPVIRDGDFVLAESLAIITYLDRKHPDPALLGRNAEEAGRIALAIADFESYLRDPITIVNRWLFGDKLRTPEVDDAYAIAKVEFERFEQRIGRGPWLVGGTPTAADIVWFPPVRTLVRAGVRNEARARELGWFPLASVFPNIGAFISRVEALPGYAKTLPPHWR